MGIYLKKRHLFMLFMLAVAIYLVVTGGTHLYKMAKAQDLTSLSEVTKGDYVNLVFDHALYTEYEDLYGKTQKNYAVYGTIDGEAFFVNALPDKFVLIETGDVKMIQDIFSGSKSTKKILGVVQDNLYDVSEFEDNWKSVAEFEDQILIKEENHMEIYRVMLWNGVLIIVFCVVIFFATGGVESLLY